MNVYGLHKQTYQCAQYKLKKKEDRVIGSNSTSQNTIKKYLEIIFIMMKLK